MNVKTANNLVVELAHPIGYKKKRSEHMYYYIVAKYIHAEPATGRIARQIEAQNERANQSVIEIDGRINKLIRIGYYIFAVMINFIIHESNAFSLKKRIIHTIEDIMQV